MFFGVFAIMAIIEAWQPARVAPLGRWTRWRGNLLLIIASAIAARIALPMTLVGVAVWAHDIHLGLLNYLNSPEVLGVVLSVLLLDMVIYWQHRWFHTVPLLWRLHQVHHADSHVDTTTGLRFHPIEIVFSLFLKAAVIVVFGVPAMAVVIFEVGLNAFALFNHANIRLPQKWDHGLGYVLITQRLHRIHHSQYKRESNSNYGFSVSWWDRLFGSFVAHAKQSDETLDIGQKAFPATAKNAGILRLLLMPFSRK
jgi:sterol desaturase/sphingolipid hydroxylase (fatty acid hydroxylase superfamily)